MSNIKKLVDETDLITMDLGFISKTDEETIGNIAMYNLWIKEKSKWNKKIKKK